VHVSAKFCAMRHLNICMSRHTCTDGGKGSVNLCLLVCLSACLLALIRRIVDTEDSFPTGAIRKPGRLYMHPDIVNLQHLHGNLLNVKYLLIARNTTVSYEVHVASITCSCVSV
jgi:hypothetical protein